MGGVRRWIPWFVVALLAGVWIVAHRGTSASMLADSDTRVLLAKIEERGDPWSWFVGDWPLENHFFRPVSTLAFELDAWLYLRGISGPEPYEARLAKLAPQAAPGFGLTNALLAAACVLALFWLLRELLDLPWAAGLGALLFAAWHVPLPGWGVVGFLAAWLGWTAWIGVLRKPPAWPSIVMANLSVLFLGWQLGPTQSFSGHVVYWLPGRTASVMALFCLLALAAYARWERTTARRDPAPPPKPTEPPNTKGTAWTRHGKWEQLWLPLSMVFAALALGSYEQAIMLPAVLLGVAVLLRTERYRPRWWVHGGFWLLLGAYLAARTAWVPSSTSGYQDQTLRTTGSALMTAGDALFPGWGQAGLAVDALSVGSLVLITSTFWWPVLWLLANGVAWVVVWRSRWRWRVLGLHLLAVVAFLPMAWLQQVFGHYHYWSSALRAGWLMLMAAPVLAELMAAWSPAPLRTPEDGA